MNDRALNRNSEAVLLAAALGHHVQCDAYCGRMATKQMVNGPPRCDVCASLAQEQGWDWPDKELPAAARVRRLERILREVQLEQGVIL